MTFEANRAVIDELLAMWDSDGDFEVRIKHAPRGRAAFAFTANAYRYAKVIRRLWDEEIYAETVPLARTCFESAVLAAWVQQSDATVVDALLHETFRNGYNLMNQLKQAGVPVPAEIEARATALRSAIAKPAPDISVQKMEEMCQSFRAGSQLYSIFRILSGETHALDALRRYLVEENGELIPIKTAGDKPNGAEQTSYLVASSLVWAGRAADELELHHPHKKVLRRAARSLRCYPILHR